jgi:glycosyltransferase involved in cell wall biosynthesis
MQIGQQLPMSHYLLPLALKSDQFVATSQTIARELMSVGVPADRITQLPNGVEIDSIPAKCNYALNNPIHLIFVGRLHEQKALDVLLMAFQKLCACHPNLRLQLLGDGPLRETLKGLAEQLGIAGQVDFFGSTEQVFEYLQKADIFILPSRAEGLSNALLEAMACGLPVITSNIPANAAVIEHERNGLLFTVEDPASLADGVNSLIDSTDLRERLGKNARQTVEKQYGLDFIAERYIALYQEMLSAHHDTA